MTQAFDVYTLTNGMVVLGERMPGVQSVAFGFLLPAGAARLPAGTCGAANVMADWVFRGAGEWDSRQLSDALDDLGLHRAAAVSTSHLTVGAALESGNLEAALALYGEILLRPHLDAEQFALARQLALEEINALEDDPRQKVMLILRERFYPAPLGTSTVGDPEVLKALDAETVQSLVREHFNPQDTLFTIAGAYDFERVCQQLESLFAENAGQPPKPLAVTGSGSGSLHIPNDGTQVHIGLMTPTVTIAEPEYYTARVAVSILSGGMSARLFTEVREKRGLCYAIGARYHGLREAAGILCYVGTTPEKAEEALTVIKDEFAGLAEGISEDELQRAKIGLKAALILQSESSSSRAGAVGGDYYLLGRIRTVDEIKANIDAVTVEALTDFLTQRPFGDYTVVTVGPSALAGVG